MAQSAFLVFWRLEIDNLEIAVLDSVGQGAQPRGEFVGRSDLTFDPEGERGIGRSEP
jgi:hypothetical protein